MFNKKTSNIFHSQKARARKHEMILDYTLDDLRNSIAKFLSDRLPCPFCKGRISITNISLDHILPFCRGGCADYTNTLLCCLSCNKMKGAMTAFEFSALMELIDAWPTAAHRDLTTRLRLAPLLMRGKRK